MSRLNHVYRTAGLAAIGVLALAGCGAGGSSASGDSSSETSICKKDASDKTSIDSAPKADWKPSSLDVKVPSSDEYGPEKTDDNKVPSCFAHSPEGGLFAATQYGTPLVIGDYKLMSEITSTQAIDNSDRDKLVEEYKDKPAEYAGQEDQLKGKIQVSGYKVTDYTKDKATYEIAFGMDSKESLGVMTFTVEWKDNDWRFDASEENQSKYGFKEGGSTDGFTKWGPDVESGSSASSSS
ncbi:hypothetical protein [Kocuria massiliensis]|uniref:hypothetical protein n=1 Tax=Kocuria massiliensis TaxID=1926282 RepID=UPI0022B97015|nr:hypothetical protein [Kocuria massiliensis]